LIQDTYDAVQGFLTLPHIAMLDSWGEANIILWALLRFFTTNTKIVIVFHHHEPRILPDQFSKIKSNFAKSAAEWYNSLVEKLTTSMIRNSDLILTVSHTSAAQLRSVYNMLQDSVNGKNASG
jgi:hypothetical protein